MSRYVFLVPVLGLIILGGCGSNADEDVPPTVTAGEELVFATPPGCHAQGTSVSVTVENQMVTKSCRCEFTTTSDWGCSNAKHCESEYDLGGPNPYKCDRLQTKAAIHTEVTATVNRPDCTIVVVEDAPDSSRRNVIITCSAEGTATATIRVGDVVHNQYLVFTPDGTCPPSDASADDDAGPDTGSQYAGDASDASREAGAEP